MNDPAVLFYTSDFLTGVMDMTMEERGQYITLLCYQHQKGHIKEETIRLLVGYVSVNVLKHFEVDENGEYFNKRMDIEKDKRHNYTESRRNNGKKGGRPKKEKTNETISDWEEMLKFFDNKCIKCGYKFEGDDRPTKDHIIPKSLGGIDDISNLQPLCRECNASKCADNTNDYRLNYIADIPQHLKDKWFKKSIEKPYGFSYNNHMGNENDNENINNNVYINNNKINNLFIEYLDIRKKSKYVVNETVIRRLLNKLIEYGSTDEEKIAIIENAINGKWKDFYKLNNYEDKPEWFNKKIELQKADYKEQSEIEEMLKEYR